MADMGWKKRLAIVLSFLWFVLSLAVSLNEQQNSLGIFVVIGIFPLAIIWGVAWIWWGYRNRQPRQEMQLQVGKDDLHTNSNEDTLVEKDGADMETGIIDKPTIENRENIVVRLYHGNISLPITYWVFGGLVGNLAFRIIQELIEKNYFEIISNTAGRWSVYVFYLLVTCYTIFILIAIWRSARKYQGKAIWANLARVGVVVGSLSLITSLISGFQQGGDADPAFSEEIKLINKSLPSMIDNETRIDHVSIQDKDVYYNYTLVNLLAVDMDISRFTIIMTQKLKTSQCANEATRSILNEGRKIVSMYRDKATKPVAKFVVDKSDCM